MLPTRAPSGGPGRSIRPGLWEWAKRAFRQRSAAGMYGDALEEMDEPHRTLWDEWTQREVRRELRQDR